VQPGERAAAERQVVRHAPQTFATMSNNDENDQSDMGQPLQGGLQSRHVAQSEHHFVGLALRIETPHRGQQVHASHIGFLCLDIGETGQHWAGLMLGEPPLLFPLCGRYERLELTAATGQKERRSARDGSLADSYRVAIGANLRGRRFPSFGLAPHEAS